MKRRKYRIMLEYRPEDGWVTSGIGWTETTGIKMFYTLKSARRHARYLLLVRGKDEIEFSRRVPGGWMPEAIWERNNQ